MKFIEGYEQFWGAVLAGGAVTAATTLALWATSLTGAVDAPDKATLAAAVTGVITALAAGIGAYLPTNTQAPPEPRQGPRAPVDRIDA